MAEGQVVARYRISLPRRRLIEGHARRLLFAGVHRNDVSDRVAEILREPPQITEEVCNDRWQELEMQNDRLFNGMANTISHARDSRSDMEESFGDIRVQRAG